MLSEQELQNVFSWQPYRSDWPIDRSNLDQTVLKHFGSLIRDMMNNPVFECTQTQTGDTTNYLEFLCYPTASVKPDTDRIGILVCVSIYAPLVAYGETIYKKDKKSFAYSFPDPTRLAKVETRILKPVEQELNTIFEKHQLKLIRPEFAATPMNAEMAAGLDSLNFGRTYLHALFQWKDS